MLYGFSLARVSENVAAPDFVSFPDVPVTLSTRDQQSLAEHVNLAGDARRSYLKILAPDVTVDFDPLDELHLSFWRAVQLHPTDFYLLRLKRKERILSQDCIVYGAGANRKVVFPHSSYTLASKRCVQNGWPSLLSDISCKVLWSDAIQEKFTPPHVNVFSSYDDVNEIASLLNVLDTPTEGKRVYASFTATAWLVKLAPGFGWAPVSSRADLHRASLTFEAV